MNWPCLNKKKKLKKKKKKKLVAEDELPASLFVNTTRSGPIKWSKDFTNIQI